MSGVLEGFHGIPGGFQEYFRRFWNEGALAWFQKDSRDVSERFRGRLKEGIQRSLNERFQGDFQRFHQVFKKIKGFPDGLQYTCRDFLEL